jgi:hypothetical protein
MRQSANLYVYTLNNPLMFVDPTGLFVQAALPLSAYIDWMSAFFSIRRAGDAGRIFKIGDVGGQCGIYAGREYSGKSFGVASAYMIWDSDNFEQLDSPVSGSFAIWSGGSDGHGHVGVIEIFNPETGLMTFSDSNRVVSNQVDVQINITVEEMENLLSSYTFLGFVRRKEE